MTGTGDHLTRSQAGSAMFKMFMGGMAVGLGGMAFIIGGTEVAVKTAWLAGLIGIVPGLAIAFLTIHRLSEVDYHGE